MRITDYQKSLMINKVYNMLNDTFEKNPDEFVTMRDICIELGLDATLTKEEKIARYVIKKARDRVRNNGGIVYNKKKVGWKIAVGGEKTIEGLKAHSRLKAFSYSACDEINITKEEEVLLSDKDKKRLSRAKKSREIILEKVMPALSEVHAGDAEFEISDELRHPLDEKTQPQAY